MKIGKKDVAPPPADPIDKVWNRIACALEKIADRMEADSPADELDLHNISISLQEISNSLASPKATKLSLSYTRQGGTRMGQPVTGTVGQVFDPTVTESNATTPSIQPIGPLVYTSDTPANVTVDPSTGVVTLVAPGTANVSVVDQGNNLTDSVAFTVDAAPPPVATALDLEYSLAASAKRKK